MALKIPTGGQFENPPPGNYIGRCYGFIDLGTQPHEGFQGKPGWKSRDVRLLFELPTVLMEGKYNPESKGKPCVVSTTMKMSLASTAKLRKFLKGWRGRDFTKEELESYVPRKMIGVPCRLSLIENEEYVNIDGISRLSPGEVCPPQVNPSIYFSLDKEEFDRAVFDSLGEKTKDKIYLSPEYQEIISPTPEPTSADYVPGSKQIGTEDQMANLDPKGIDEDVPF